MRTEDSSAGLPPNYGDIMARMLPLFGEFNKAVYFVKNEVYIGKDVSVEANGQRIEPFSPTQLTLRVPAGYFRKTLGPIDEESLIRYLLHINYFSMRSRLAQAGVECRPLIPSGSTAADIPVTLDNGIYNVQVIVDSQNPKLSFKLPKGGDFPFFRFMVYPFKRRLCGMDLVKALTDFQTDPGSVELVTLKGHRMALEDCKNISPLHPYVYSLDNYFGSVAVKIERWARFNEQREVDLEVLCRTKTRQEIDEVLGLNWNTSENDEVVDEFEYMIGETPKVAFPYGIAGVINLGFFETENSGRASHSCSVLIDPEFGRDSGGMPIRTEHVVTQRIGQPRKAPKFLELFLFNRESNNFS